MLAKSAELSSVKAALDDAKADASVLKLIDLQTHLLLIAFPIRQLSVHPVTCPFPDVIYGFHVSDPSICNLTYDCFVLFIYVGDSQ